MWMDIMVLKEVCRGSCCAGKKFSANRRGFQTVCGTVTEKKQHLQGTKTRDG
jgi:hypothetical protein